MEGICKYPVSDEQSQTADGWWSYSSRVEGGLTVAHCKRPAYYEMRNRASSEDKHYDDKTNEDEEGRACNTPEERCVENFGRKSLTIKTP
jgi:hypothetical protein